LLPLLSAIFVQRKLIALEERREVTVAAEHQKIVWAPRKASRRVLVTGTNERGQAPSGAHFRPRVD
jgi:hypothetical protein